MVEIGYSSALTIYSKQSSLVFFVVVRKEDIVVNIDLGVCLERFLVVSIYNCCGLNVYEELEYLVIFGTDLLNFFMKQVSAGVKVDGHLES